MTCRDCMWFVSSHSMFGENVCTNPESQFCTEQISEDMMCTEFEAKGD